jgi:predicted MPP superfamily phosphohydrolase
MFTRRRFLKISATALGCGAGVGVYAWRVEPHWLELVERRLRVTALPENLTGKRLVQLSDLHIGPRVDDGYLRRTFERVKQLAPEFVVYTGDFTSHEPQVFDHARRMFAHLPLGRQGTWGILGNHDYGIRWSQPHVAQRIAGLATDAGVRVLRNEVVEIGGLYVVGLDDLWADRFDLAAGLGALPAGAPAVVLSHNPDTVDLPGWGNYSGWILAGHTHGGQCKPPFLPPPLLPVRNRRYTCGEFGLSGGRRL